MEEAKQGDRVRVHYTGILDDQSEFDSSSGGDPLEFTVGDGGILPAFEAAVLGMSPGDQVETRIPAADAYGERRDDLVLTIPRNELPADLDPQIGQQLGMQTGDGDQFVVRVTGRDEASVTVDANHPLAGEDLTFQIELVEIL